MPLIGLRIPERADQADLRKNLDHLIGRRSARINRQSIAIPRDRQVPQLIERDHWSNRNVVFTAPLLDCLFRPEEEHRRSSVDDVHPPTRGWHSKMREAIIWHGLPIFDLQLDRFATKTVFRIDDRILMQRRRNAE